MKEISEKKERMVSQDIAKGIAILLVVLIHSIQVTKPIGIVIGVLFGYIMPFFLFMAGYNYNDKGLSIKENIKRRTIQLLKPFFIFSISIFVLMGIYFLVRGEATILELLKSYFIFLISKWGLNIFGWEFNQILFQRLLGPYWFIQFLVMSNLIFIPFYEYTKNDNKKLFSSIILLSGISVVLINFKIELPWGIHCAPAIAGLLLLSTYFKKNNILFNENYSKKWTVINCFICILTVGMFQLNANGAGFVGAGDLGSAMGGAEVYAMYAMAICGSYFLINFCKLLEKIKYVNKFFCWFGKHSFLILMIHMSIVHIVKDLFGLEQRNAAASLFGDSVNLLEIPATIVILSIIILFVYLWDSRKSKI